MTTRVATFNVENLFRRPRAMNLPELSQGQGYLTDYAQLLVLLNKETYSPEDKTSILELLQKYGLDQTRPNNRYLELRQIRGKLLERHKDNPTVVKANGRSSWVGSVELKSDAISDAAITNTARVIAEVNPDILVLVEVENRPALIRFHDQILKPLLTQRGIPPYEHLMCIDGNDERGIDVAIMSRKPIQAIRSHVDDHNSKGNPVFSRDCPEYYLVLEAESNGSGEIVVLPNHFASKGSDPEGIRRSEQAAAVKAIYEKIRETHNYVAVMGDFNDYPEGGSLDALLKETDLRDAMSLEAYHGEYPGTYMNATAKQKIDYLLLSPDLAERVTAVDVDRHGYYSPQKWESFENINRETKDRNQASDHHCVYADLAI